METELLPRIIFLRFIVTKVVSFTALLVTLQIVRAVVFNFRAKFVKLFAALAVEYADLVERPTSDPAPGKKLARSAETKKNVSTFFMFTFVSLPAETPVVAVVYNV